MTTPSTGSASVPTPGSIDQNTLDKAAAVVNAAAAEGRAPSIPVAKPSFFKRHMSSIIGFGAALAGGALGYGAKAYMDSRDQRHDTPKAG